MTVIITTAEEVDRRADLWVREAEREATRADQLQTELYRLRTELCAALEAAEVWRLRASSPLTYRVWP